MTREAAPAPPKGVPAVRRAAAILALLARRREPLTLTQIAQAVGILPSSCLLILRELAAARMVAVDARRKTYRPGYGLVELARGVTDQDPLSALAEPFLKDLAERFGMTVTLTVPVDDHVVLVAHAQPREAISINVTPGGRVPLLSGAAGRLLAAETGANRAALQRAFQGVRWQIAPAFETWLAEVEAAGRDGWAEDQGCFTRGVTTVAVPIRGADDVIAGVLGVGAISVQLDARLRTRVLAALRKSARLIGRQL